VVVDGESMRVTAADASATTLTVAPGTGSRFHVGDVVRVPSDAYTGAGLSLDDERVRVLGVTGDMLTVPWNVAFYQAGLDVVAGTTYTLSFWVRASASRAINAVIQQTSGDWAVRAGQDVTLDTSWRHYTLTFTPSATESGLRVQFNVAQAVGSVWLGGVSFQQGDPNVWERDFTHGAVLVNGTDSPQTVDIGPGYRRVAGTQDPAVNNGIVATSVTLAPHDAILLTKTS